MDLEEDLSALFKLFSSSFFFKISSSIFIDFKPTCISLLFFVSKKLFVDL